MPILSAVQDPAYPTDTRFIPSSEQPTSPDYGFSFDAPYGYVSHFNFDRCPDDAVPANPYPKNPAKPPPILDLNDQNLFYRRLFRLADTGGKPRFYLCPWLIVPFDKKPTGGFTVTIRNDQNAASVTLIARPFLASQPDSIQPTKTPGAATKLIRTLAQPRTLTLGTSAGSPISATWKKTSYSNNKTMIDETQCAVSQELEITFNDLPGPSPYPYSCDLTITNKDGNLVGQLCLVFVQMTEIPTILFDVSPDTLHKMKVTQLTQAEADKKLNGPNSNKKTGLNGILERCGLRFVSAPSQVKMKTNSSAMSPGIPIYFPLDEIEVDKNDIDQPAKITGQFLNAIETIDGKSADFSDQTWKRDRSAYLFVFFMSYVKLEEKNIDMQPTGETAGLAYFHSRNAHIFDSIPRTIAHECGHAFGLWHIFYPGKDSPSQQAIRISVGRAAICAETLQITTQSELYGFYDDANWCGLTEALRTWWPSTNGPFGSRYQTSLYLHTLLAPRRYVRHSTDNLMDYIKSGQMSSKEAVRKDQVEQLRSFV